MLAISPVAAALPDTKVVLPHYQRFADTGRDFLLETTIPADFKTRKALCGGCSHCHRSARTNSSPHIFSLTPYAPARKLKVHSLFTCTFAVYGMPAAKWFFAS